MEIQIVGELDERSKNATKSWWSNENERPYGGKTIEQARAHGCDRQEVTLACYDNDGVVIGMANGNFLFGLGYLHELIVDEKSRGQGVGAALLAEFEDMCRTRHCYELALRTQSDEAVAFYRHHGWHIEFTSEQWMGGIPNHQMRKSLRL